MRSGISVAFVFLPRCRKITSIVSQWQFLKHLVKMRIKNIPRRLKHIIEQYFFRPYVAKRNHCGYAISFHVNDLFAKKVYDFPRAWPEIEWAKQELIHAKGAIIDVGANQGVTSVIYANIARSFAGHVIAVEPHTKNADLIIANAALNNIDTIAVIRCAVSDQAGTITIADHSNASRINDGSRGIVVSINRIDQIVQEPVALLKIDVEGMDFQALTGAEKIIRDCRPLIDLECHLFTYVNPAEKIHEILRFLQPYDYVYKVVRGYQGNLVDLDVNNFDSREILGTDVVNLLCTPRTRL